MQQRLFRRGFVVAALGFILLLTLTPTSAEPTRADMWCLVCGHLGGRDLVLNVLLFVPLGFGLGLAGVGWRTALVFLGTLTLAIELLQMHVIAGRDASLGDLLANSVGGSAGYLVGTHRGRLLRPPRALARRLTLAAAACALSLFLATAWGVRPSLPRSRYYAQWAADMSNFGHFTGRIIAAKAGTEPFPPIGEIVESARFRARLLAGEAPLAAIVAPSPSQEPSLSPILSVFEERRREIVLLGQEAHSVVFHMRTRSMDALFPIVGVRLSGVFEPATDIASAPADSVLVAGGMTDGRLWVLGSRDGAVRRAEIALGPEIGWHFLLPWRHELGPWSGLLSAIWVAGIFLPLAYWSARCARPRAASAWMAVPPAVAALSLGVLPMLLGIAPAGWPAWLSCALASVGGWVLAAGGDVSVSPPGSEAA